MLPPPPPPPAIQVLPSPRDWSKSPGIFPTGFPFERFWLFFSAGEKKQNEKEAATRDFSHCLPDYRENCGEESHCSQNRNLARSFLPSPEQCVLFCQVTSFPFEMRSRNWLSIMINGLTEVTGTKLPSPGVQYDRTSIFAGCHCTGKEFHLQQSDASISGWQFLIAFLKHHTPRSTWKVRSTVAVRTG